MHSIYTYIQQNCISDLCISYYASQNVCFIYLTYVRAILSVQILHVQWQ